MAELVKHVRALVTTKPSFTAGACRTPTLAPARSALGSFACRGINGQHLGGRPSCPSS